MSFEKELEKILEAPKTRQMAAFNNVLIGEESPTMVLFLIVVRKYADFRPRVSAFEH